MSASKVTIVIPTRERHETLGACLRSCLNQDYENLEILVSDNASGPETKRVVDSFADPRIRYVNTGRRLSMSGNYEFAQDQVDDGWIVQIGDDDALLPNSLKRPVALLEETGLEALIAPNVTYYWPGTHFGQANTLVVPFGRGHAIIDARKALARVMDWRIYAPGLPYIYTGGIVSASLRNRIKAVDGRFLHSKIPDIYSALALSSVIDRYIASAEPFAIAGTSPSSNGFALAAGLATPFQQEDNIPYHDRLMAEDMSELTGSAPILYIDCYLQSSYLRPDDPGLTDAFILESVLGQAGSDPTALDRWARRFAEARDLDLAAARKRAGRRSVRRTASRLRDRIRMIAGSYRVSRSPELPLVDVYEASIFTRALLDRRPSRVRNFMATARKAVGTRAEMKRAMRIIWSKSLQETI